MGQLVGSVIRAAGFAMLDSLSTNLTGRLYQTCAEKWLARMFAGSCLGMGWEMMNQSYMTKPDQLWVACE